MKNRRVKQRKEIRKQKYISKERDERDKRKKQERN
jgi:hypothetical protein